LFFEELIKKLNCIFATLKINKSIRMYAIVEIAGQQFSSKDLKVYVHRLTNEEGSKFLLTKFFIR
jgi:hypothetical protein